MFSENIHFSRTQFPLSGADDSVYASLAKSIIYEQKYLMKEQIC